MQNKKPVPAMPMAAPVAPSVIPKPKAKQKPKLNRSAAVMKRGYHKMGGM